MIILDGKEPMENINEELKETINERVTRHRKLKGYTQARVAELMGLKCSTYSQMERNGNITAEKLLQIEQIFDLPRGELLYGSSLEPKEDNVLRFAEPDETKSLRPEPMVITNNEQNYISILRNLPKKARDEVIDLLQQKYDEFLK